MLKKEKFMYRRRMFKICTSIMNVLILLLLSINRDTQSLTIVMECIWLWIKSIGEKLYHNKNGSTSLILQITVSPTHWTSSSLSLSTVYDLGPCMTIHYLGPKLGRTDPCFVLESHVKDLFSPTGLRKNTNISVNLL